MPPHLPCHCTFNLREMKIAHLFHRYHHHHCHYFITCAHDLDSMNGLKIHCKRCKKVLLAEDATIATYPSCNPFLKHTSPNCTLSTKMQCTKTSLSVMHQNPSTLHSIYWYPTSYAPCMPHWKLQLISTDALIKCAVPNCDLLQCALYFCSCRNFHTWQCTDKMCLQLP